MVNTAKLKNYIDKANRSWFEIEKDIGGLPLSMEEFAEKFESDISANQITVIAEYCKIPASQIGLVFFAPAWYDEDERPHLDDLNEFDDVLADIFHGLSVRSRTKLMGEAFKLQDQEAAQ